MQDAHGPSDDGGYGFGVVDSSAHGTRGSAVTRLPWRIARAGLAGLQRRWQQQPLARDTVLFESFGGTTFGCNPLALYRGMIADPRFSDFEFVWAVSDTALARSARPEMEADRRTDFVRHRSRQYYRTLATAQYLVNNVAFPVSFTKRPDQVYVNTWHGTPLKRMGRDVPGGDPAVLEHTVANLRSADVLLSTSDYMTDVMYCGAFGLTGPDRAKILQVGYPRVDQQFDPVEQARAVAGLAAAGMDPSGRRVVACAPTWRQASDVQAADDSQRLAEIVTALVEELPPSDWLVVLRVHDKALPHAADHPLLARHLAPEAIATNALLGVADTLVTDYSSVFFDYLATGSRVVFLAPDRGAYAASRGLYLSDEELPGPITTDAREAAGWIRGEAQPARHASAAASRQRFCPDDDGHATSRVLAAVFGP